MSLLTTPFAAGEGSNGLLSSDPAVRRRQLSQLKAYVDGKRADTKQTRQHRNAVYRAKLAKVAHNFGEGIKLSVSHPDMLLTSHQTSRNLSATIHYSSGCRNLFLLRPLVTRFSLEGASTTRISLCTKVTTSISLALAKTAALSSSMSKHARKYAMFLRTHLFSDTGSMAKLSLCRLMDCSTLSQPPLRREKSLTCSSTSPISTLPPATCHATQITTRCPCFPARRAST